MVSLLVLTSFIAIIVKEATVFFSSNFVAFLSTSLVVLGTINLILEFDEGMLIWASIWGIIPGLIFIFIVYRIQRNEKSKPHNLKQILPRTSAVLHIPSPSFRYPKKMLIFS